MPRRVGAPRHAGAWRLLLLLLTCTAVAYGSCRRLQSEVEAENGRCRPSQIHLALTGDNSEMRVSWKTHSLGCPNKVHYALSRGEVERNALHTDANAAPTLRIVGATETEYGPDDLCASPARDYSYGHQFFQSAVLVGLSPGRVYYYRVHGSDEVRSFSAPPEVGPRAQFSFLAFGDLGDSSHARAKSPGAAYTGPRLAGEVDDGVDLILHVGDIAYADGNPAIWDAFMHEIEPAASRVPYMVAVGNHEYDYQNKHHEGDDPSGASHPYNPEWGNYGNDSGGECGVPFASRFLMPDGRGGAWAAAAGAAAAAAAAPNGTAGGVGGGAGGSAASGDAADGAGGEDNRHSAARPPASNPPFWYAFEYGSAAVVTISTEHDLSRDSEQYGWLAAALAAVDRCRTPWLILVAHRPMYVVHPHKSNRIVAEHLRNFLEGLLNEHQVDLVLSGHVHNYARTCNVLNGHCTAYAAGGSIHATIGSAGHELSAIGSDQEGWLAHAEREYGYGRVHVDGAHALRFEFVASKDGEILDSVEIRGERYARRYCKRAYADGARVFGGGAGDGAGDGAAAAV